MIDSKPAHVIVGFPLLFSAFTQARKRSKMEYNKFYPQNQNQISNLNSQISDFKSQIKI